ncbi:hypothetical protein P8452_52996 [Trifolium repens]|nr:hypothetical protein P8452_52996 [Trifolium repens]
MDQGFEIDSQTHSTPPCNTPMPAYKELTVLSPKGIPAANAPSSDQDNNVGNMDKQLQVIVDQQDSDSDESFINATQNLGHADTQFPLKPYTKLLNEAQQNDIVFLESSETKVPRNGIQLPGKRCRSSSSAAINSDQLRPGYVLE